MGGKLSKEAGRWVTCRGLCAACTRPYHEKYMREISHHFFWEQIGILMMYFDTSHFQVYVWIQLNVNSIPHHLVCASGFGGYWSSKAGHGVQNYHVLQWLACLDGQGEYDSGAPWLWFIIVWPIWPMYISLTCRCSLKIWHYVDLRLDYQI